MYMYTLYINRHSLASVYVLVGVSVINYTHDLGGGGGDPRVPSLLYKMLPHALL